MPREVSEPDTLKLCLADSQGMIGFASSGKLYFSNAFFEL